MDIENLTGEEILPLAKPFGEVLRELNVAIVQHFQSKVDAAKHSFDPDLVRIAAEMNRTILIYQSRDDELTHRIDAAFEALEQKLRKHIR